MDAQVCRKDYLILFFTHRDDDADRANEGPYKSFLCMKPASKREMERDSKFY